MYYFEVENSEDEEELSVVSMHSDSEAGEGDSPTKFRIRDSAKVLNGSDIAKEGGTKSKAMTLNKTEFLFSYERWLGTFSRGFVLLSINLFITLSFSNAF